MSLRQKAEQITKGNREPEHLGSHTPETLIQELFSLKNIKPMFRDSKWRDRYDKIYRQIEAIKDKRLRAGIYNKAAQCLSGEC